MGGLDLASSSSSPIFATRLADEPGRAVPTCGRAAGRQPHFTDRRSIVPQETVADPHKAHPWRPLRPFLRRHRRVYRGSGAFAKLSGGLRICNPLLDKTGESSNPIRGLVASVAQLVEQLTLNQLVLGSSPSRGTTLSQENEVSGPFFRNRQYTDAPLPHHHPPRDCAPPNPARPRDSERQ